MNGLKLKSAVIKRSLISPQKAKLPVPCKGGFYDVSIQKLQKNKFIGKFNGFSVIIDDKTNMDILYTMGCFGKGSLSRGYPSFNMRNSSPGTINNAKRKISEIQSMDGENCISQLIDQRQYEDSVEVSQNQPIKLNHPAGCSDTRNEDNLIRETLHLLLEEAFFLCFALDILIVYHKNEPLALPEMWKLFRSVQPGFVNRYVAYHYFRSKGWVVKPGTKYGGDFLLYKQGPSFYHSSYLVLVRRFNNSSNDSNNNENHNWKYLLALQRVAESVNKHVVVCEILPPSDFEEDDLSQLKRCNVSEFILDRWIASENRI